MAVRASKELTWPLFNLNNGTTMPPTGINTSHLNTDESMKATVNAALQAGCRMFETSGINGNDAALGKALNPRLYIIVISREDVFIVRKLQYYEMYTKHTIERAFTKTLENLETDYLDLLLINCPGASYTTGLKTKHKMICNSAWETITGFYDQGQVNAIGVADFSTIQMQDLINENYNCVPCVSQVQEWVPNQYGREISSSCRENAIVVQSRYPIAEVDDKYKSVGKKVLRNIASDLDVTPDQVMLAWNLQNDNSIVLEASDPKQITSSLQLEFRLDASQMSALNKIYAKK